MLLATVFIQVNDIYKTSVQKTYEGSWQLGLASIKGTWHIHSTCATIGEGLYEGMDWLTKQVSKTK